MPEAHPVRRSLRLQGYDYRQAGAYFVTICSAGRQCCFGRIEAGELLLANLGLLAEGSWRDLAKHWPDLALDAFVVMPNHLHGIVWLTGGAENWREARAPRTSGASPIPPEARARQASPLPGVADWPVGYQEVLESELWTKMASLGCGPRLGDIVGSFKAAVTRLARAELGWCGAPLWQRGFYENVVRDEADLDRARHYIQDNPLRWLLDRENPGRDR